MNKSHGVNMVHIPDDVLTDAKDGDDVDFHASGKLVEHDGKRFVSVAQADGSDVEEMPNTDQSQESTETKEGEYQDSNDALDGYMKNK